MATTTLTYLDHTDNVHLESSPEDGYWFVKNHDGLYLSAHDNLKHLEWLDKNEPWTWEMFQISDDYLVTYHDTFCTYDTEENCFWQKFEEDGKETLRVTHSDPPPSEKPKRKANPAMKAFQDWAKTRRSAVKAENPDMLFKDIQKILGSEWKQISDEEKQQWYP